MIRESEGPGRPKRPWSTDLDCGKCGAKAPDLCVRRDYITGELVPKQSPCWVRLEKAKELRQSGAPVPITKRRSGRPRPPPRKNRYYEAVDEATEWEGREEPIREATPFCCAHCRKLEHLSQTAPDADEDTAWIVICPNGQAYGMVVVCSIKCAADYFADRLKQLEDQREHQRSS